MQESGSPVLLEHLFRREAGRIVAWLAGLLGSANLQLAEDAAQEAMLRAAQTWLFQGIPSKPEAWLFRTAHNYAISSVRRGAVFKSKADALVTALETGPQPKLDLDAEQSLRDDELRMVFMCCHPKLAPDAQVALSLKLVGGFSTEEIARIFFSERNPMLPRFASPAKFCFQKLRVQCRCHLEKVGLWQFRPWDFRFRTNGYFVRSHARCIKEVAVINNFQLVLENFFSAPSNV